MMIECKTIMNKNSLSIISKYYYRNTEYIRKLKIVLLICGVLLFLIGIPFLTIQFFTSSFDLSGNTSFIIFAVILGAICLWYVAGGMEKQGTYAIVKQYFKNGEKEKVYNYTFTKEGINIEDSGNTAFYKWSSIEKNYEEGHYYIYVANSKYIVIDKMGFVGNSQSEFENLIKEVLKEPIDK
ncbi:MAG: YcxB family protein [Ruminococcus sp.]|nr:YcxB family protein [Ruminococcus sp.]